MKTIPNVFGPTLTVCLIICLSLVPLSCLVFGQQTLVKETSRGRYLERAIECANWLDSQRVDRVETTDGETTVWASAPSLNRSISYNLYNGTSGIVLFYLQIYKSTGEKAYLQTAQRGANALLQHVGKLNRKSDPGFWTGYTGIGATLAETYRATDDKKYLDGYQTCFEWLEKACEAAANSGQKNARLTPVTDIISGSAGIGFFLLYADRVMNDKRALPLAFQIADELLESAIPVDSVGKAEGLKWMMAPTYPREMPNYSHGTAGICDFLFQLDQRIIELSKEANSKRNLHEIANYDRRFLDAAFGGGRYLVSLAENEHDGFRIIHHRIQKEVTGAGDGIKKEAPLYYYGWCHGPSGTGKTFVNFSRNGDKEKYWYERARQCGNTLLNSQIPEKKYDGYWNNVGVCCGASGVGSFCLDLFQVTGNTKLKELAIRLAENSLERGTRHELDGEKIGLSWTHAEHRSRPDYLHTQTGIMQGTAGMGLWFLKLDAAIEQKEFKLDIPLHPLRN